MKSKSLILLISLGMIYVQALKAQTPESPANYKLEKDADYAGYEGKIKEEVKWYETSPLDKNEDLHKQISAFLVKWASGAPNVTVSVGDVAAPIVNDKDYKYNGDLLIVYMGGIMVYELNNSSVKDEIKIETAGVEAVLELYKNNSDLLKDSQAVKKYKQLKDKVELENWIKDTIAKASK
jgi:hypothetical protein